MCGDMPARPSFGGRIAVMFPPASTEPVSSTVSSSSSSSRISPFTLFFNNDSTGTRATFKVDDAQTLRALQRHKRVELRIEKYGDLSSSTTTPRPLHSFPLRTENTEMEFVLPEKLDLGVSETGVLGRQVTIRSSGGDILLGTGIVGWN